MESKQITRKDQILWYFAKIVDFLTDTQSGAVLTMLKRFYGQLKKRGEV